MTKIKLIYSKTRSRVLDNGASKKFFNFVSLPELKLCKTLGFITSILL